jgi:glycosyltransferase involved in cell wall biosynthesis
MKFVFFSPFLSDSAIGRVTALIVNALAELGHSAVVVRAEQEHLLSRPVHACSTEVLLWTQNDAVLEAIEGADAIIYQIGDNYLYHQGCLHWMQTHPGIVCLHDFFVAHLFMGWAQGRLAEAENILNRWYGEGAAREFFGSAGDAETFIQTASRAYPMTEWICSMAHCVVSHSHWGMARVLRSCAGPACVQPLPYDAPAAVPVSDLPSAPKEDRINILSVGHANANKRIESVIRAIGLNDFLRSRVNYRLCGPIDPSTAISLSALARALKVEFMISGPLESLALQNAFNNADIVCSLRWPSLEAASAGVIESLLYGKPVVVTDTGFYSELPDECVQKISPQNELADLQQALVGLCTSDEARHVMALRGQQWATQTFRAQDYAEQLVAMAAPALASSPAIRMVDALLNQLGRWGGTAALLTSEDIAEPLQIFEATWPASRAP